MRLGATLAALICLCLPRAAAAQWQFKPWVGATYNGSSTFVADLDQAAGRPHLAFGGNASYLGEIFGLEADFGHTPGFFQRGSQPVSNSQPGIVNSGVTTFTGNVIVAFPRRLTEYTLRPYFAGGMGMMHITIDDLLGVLPVSENLKTMDLGAGVTGFLTKRVGLSWDVRYFRSIDRTIENGVSFTSEHLSFWRASMAVAIRL